MNRTLIDYYRCPEEFATIFLSPNSSRPSDYSGFGTNPIGHGSVMERMLCANPAQRLRDAFEDAQVEPGKVVLSFNPDEAIDNLRFEQYCTEKGTSLAGEAIASIYYMVRPLLGVPIRRHFQRFRLRDWRAAVFPAWPVDRTTEQVHEMLLHLCLRAHAGVEIPFIWFWPDGFSSCIAITHDVETARGRDFCATLMDIDDHFGIKSSIQVVPEGRYSLPPSFLKSVRARGFELNIHDLNHDGRLFASEQQFRERASRINQHAKRLGAQGFRSGVLYRNLEWYDAFDLSYDMSVPNTARLDPQRGGCCTVMPYFKGKILEIPLTTTQDYTLLHILNDYSLKLWHQQLDIIGSSHGVATFNIHPDYVIETKAQHLYIQLLQHVEQLRDQHKVWIALPGEIAKWWRHRAEMRLVHSAGKWKIEGPDADRARLAYSRLRNGELEYSWSGQRQHQQLQAR
jgi:hypothetical protein